MASSLGSLVILPRELRDQTYRYLLPSDATVFHPNGEYFFTAVAEKGQDLDTLATFKTLLQIDHNHEAFDVFFRHTTFHYHIGLEPTTNYCTGHTELPVEDLVRRIQNVTFRIDPQGFSCHHLRDSNVYKCYQALVHQAFGHFAESHGQLQTLRIDFVNIDIRHEQLEALLLLFPAPLVKMTSLKEFAINIEPCERSRPYSSQLAMPGMKRLMSQVMEHMEPRFGVYQIDLVDPGLGGRHRFICHPRDHYAKSLERAREG